MPSHPRGVIRFLGTQPVNVGRYPLVTTAEKVFWQQGHPLPKYHGTYDVKIVLKLIENLGENKTLSLKQGSCRCSLPCQDTVWFTGPIKT